MKYKRQSELLLLFFFNQSVAMVGYEELITRSSEQV